ncbi:MAG: cobalt-precorrin-5B (C(1))-methyltransferase [Pseudomonadota bacterium]
MGRNGDAKTELRRGWTTGACATAATKAALEILWGYKPVQDVQITLPKGETPVFALAEVREGPDWVSVGITKDAGDDPDVTHGALIIAKVQAIPEGGVVFKAGDGVGRVTRPGLPIKVGEPSINPVPRSMMRGVVEEQAARFGQVPNVEIEVSVPGGQELALKTWNPRLGIEGGISILGTTGVVRPFSCAAWIASIHRGIDVARADGLTHVAGCTGATSERVVQERLNLPDHAMLDMGDFAGGLLKYLAKHPIERITIGGGIGKITKMAQGARDLHSVRSQVDFADLSERFEAPWILEANTALEVSERLGAPLADWAAQGARDTALEILKGAPVAVDVVVIDRAGTVLGQSQ